MPDDKHLGKPNKPDLGLPNPPATIPKVENAEPELIPAHCGNGTSADDANSTDSDSDSDYRKMPAVELTPGGLGSGGIQDVRMLQRALREGWDITPEMLAKVPAAMAGLVAGARDERARVNAAKVLVMMRGQNLEEAKEERSGGVQRVDITSGGKPLGEAVRQLSDEELAQRLGEAG